MSKDELKDLVLPASGGGEIEEWLPEDYGFNAVTESRDLFIKGNLELRRRQYNRWLLRKKQKNERGNTEIKIKWWIVIEPKEKEFADLMFTLGLR